MKRKKIPPETRHAVEKRSRYRCSYCLTQKRVTGIQLVIDHIVPLAVAGDDQLNNLCSACWDCNLLKSHHTYGFDSQTEQPVPLFHPNEQVWSDHFQWVQGGVSVKGLTAIGRATVLTLQLNRESSVSPAPYGLKVDGIHPTIALKTGMFPGSRLG